jgi:hypothetical protein
VGSRRLLALVTLLAFTAGCFGYNKSAKRWAYAGNTVLILGGGGLIAGDALTRETEPDLDRDGIEDCMQMGPPCPYQGPFDGRLNGMMIAGVMLATAGVIGMLINATRPNVKTSR